MNTLETTLEKVGRVLSDEYGIRLICKGNRCCTDGKNIFLPALPDDIPIRHRKNIKSSQNQAPPNSSANTGTGSPAASSPAGANPLADDSEPGVIGGLAQDIADSVSRYADIIKAYRVWSRERDEVSTPAVHTSVSHAERMAPLTRHVAGVRQKLVLSLMAEDRARWILDQDVGKLNPRALHRLASARMMKSAAPTESRRGKERPRVFRKRAVAARLKTSVTLLLDLSHSMNGRKLDIARDTALVFCESLERLNIPVAVWGFSTTKAAIDAAAAPIRVSVQGFEGGFDYEAGNRLGAAAPAR